jgi:hypothetical protein
MEMLLGYYSERVWNGKRLLPLAEAFFYGIDRSAEYSTAQKANGHPKGSHFVLLTF